MGQRRESSSNSPPFSWVLSLVPSYSSYHFKLWIFFCDPGKTNFLTILQYYLSPLQLTVLGIGVPFVTVSLFHLLFSTCYLLLSCCSVRAEYFFQRNCFINRCIFVMSVKEVSSGSFHSVILGLLPNY